MFPKRIVFSGGGTRCLVYLQALVDIEKKGMLRDVNEYWGTSAGAMIASLYALTKSPQRVKDIMFSANYNKFRDIDISNLFGIQKTWGLDDGNSLVQEIERIFESIEPGSKNIQLSETPTLNIVISDITLRKTVVCNAESFPKLRLVDALRASMCLPIFFKPYTHPESGNLWVDGAVKANFPWHCLPNDQARSEALGFTFEKSYMHNTPKTFFEYLFSMIHFDEPKKINYLKTMWSNNIIWFKLPPFPSWFIRLQKEDYELVEKLGREGVEAWFDTMRRTQEDAVGTKEHSQYPLRISETLPSSGYPQIQQSSIQKESTNELSDNLIPGSRGCCHEDFSTSSHLLSLSSQTQKHHKQLPCRRWSL
jgi:predicted acylesterase/phospholipase RssA